MKFSMHASAPRYPLEMTSTSTPSSSSTTTGKASSMHRSPSSEWHEWEELLDDYSTVSGLLGIDTTMDGVDLDQILFATADDFLEPYAGSNSTPNSPIFTADQEFLYEKEQDLKMLRAAGFDVHFNGETSSLLDDKVQPQKLLQERELTVQTTPITSTGHRHRKRKTVELHRVRDSVLDLGKKVQRQEQVISVTKEMKATEQMEKLYRRRYDILYGILEAWNTGGIEDLEEIADNVYDDNVTLVSPDYSEGLHGVEAVLSHWGLLLDAFPDGMMEEYIIQRDEDSNEKMKATWTFSGTQIFPIFGVEPRHKKVCISGTSLFRFKGDRIQQIVLSWNYGETLLKLMGVQPQEIDGVVLSASASTITSHSAVNQ